jgi:hypothetical protein
MGTGQPRERLELVSALICVLAGIAMSLWLASILVARVAPELNKPHQPTLIEAVTLLVGALTAISVGSIIGGIVLVLLWSPFSDREQLERFAQPDIPPFSSVLKVVIRLIRRREL